MTINSYDNRPIGSGLYLSLSALDHCCDPLATVTFDGRKAILRAVREKRCSDEKVTITYCGDTIDPVPRKEFLKATYYFDCRCFLCEDPAHSLLVGAFKCPQCGHCVTLEGQVQKCTGCAASVETLLSRATGDVEEADLLICRFSKGLKDEALMTKCVSFLRASVLGECHAKRVALLESLFESLLSLGWHDKAAVIGEAYVKAFRLVRPEYDSDVGIVHFKLGKLFDLLDCFPEADRHYREALPILRITHGDSSRLVGDLQEILAALPRSDAERDLQPTGFELT